MTPAVGTVPGVESYWFLNDCEVVYPKKLRMDIEDVDRLEEKTLSLVGEIE